VQLRNNQGDNTIANLNQAILILKEVRNPRKLWQAHASLGSAFRQLGRLGEAREQWGAAAEIIRKTANGLSARELREGFLTAEPIRKILSKAER
jgi:Flp pilus assembly protein TadD